MRQEILEFLAIFAVILVLLTALTEGWLREQHAIIVCISFLLALAVVAFTRISK